MMKTADAHCICVIHIVTHAFGYSIESSWSCRCAELDLQAEVGSSTVVVWVNCRRYRREFTRPMIQWINPGITDDEPVQLDFEFPKTMEWRLIVGGAKWMVDFCSLLINTAARCRDTMMGSRWILNMPRRSSEGLAALGRLVRYRLCVITL